ASPISPSIAPGSSNGRRCPTASGARRTCRTRSRIDRAMTLDRRSLLLSMGAIAALRAISAFPTSKSPAQPQAAASTADADANRLLSDAAEELLAEYPENASMLGLDREARAALKSRLTDRSPAGVTAAARAAAARLKRLDAIDRGQLATATR